MTPEDIAYLYSQTSEYRSIRYDLRNMQVLAAALGSPQESFRSVLIAGTNGKGSVAALLAGMMPEAGLYTSPHLVRLNERIQIGGIEISDQDLKAVFERVRSTAAEEKNLLYPATYFELVTAMGFCYFQDRVQFAVLEVGLGGRLDATNVVRQDASVITSIGFDHQEFLGSTLEEIAGEKAGIVKGGEPVIVGPSVCSAVIDEKAGSKLVSTEECEVALRPADRGCFEIDVRTPVRTYQNLKPKLPGRHQIENVLVAIRTAECLGALGWPINRAAIEAAVNTTTWPGRLESIDVPGGPSFLLDGAHNAPSAEALAKYLGEFYPKGVWLIFGAMADKAFEKMICMLKPHAQRMIFTRAGSRRAKDPQELGTMFPGSVVEPDVPSAIAYVRNHAPPSSTVLICGSLYLVGEARDVLKL